MSDEDRFRELVNEAAQHIADDINAVQAGDVEMGLSAPIDTSFEVYVYVIDGYMIGYVYMGECGEWVYEWDDDAHAKVQMCFTPGMLERAKELSPYSRKAGW